MSDLVIDSRPSRPSDLLDSRSTPQTTTDESWSAAFVFEPTNAEQLVDGGVISAEDVEGVPLGIVRLYAEIATRHAITRQIEPGVWVATVAGLEGAWGDGDSPEEAGRELEEAIVGWIAVKRRVGARDIPPMEGIDLNPGA